MDEYDDGPYWAILLMYGSHDMRHTGFRRLTVVNGTPGFWGVTRCDKIRWQGRREYRSQPGERAIQLSDMLCS